MELETLFLSANQSNRFLTLALVRSDYRLRVLNS